MHTILLVVIVVLLLANVGVSVACLVKANKKNEKYEEPTFLSLGDEPLLSSSSDTVFEKPDEGAMINKAMFDWSKQGGMGGREESMMLS